MKSSLTSLSYGAVSTSLVTFTNTSITTFNTSIVNAFTNLQNLSCVNSSFIFINVGNLSRVSGSFYIINISTLKCTDLYNFINTSITANVNNYNTSLVTYVNTSLGNAITKYKLQYLTAVTSDVQSQMNNCVRHNVSLKQKKAPV